MSSSTTTTGPRTGCPPAHPTAPAPARRQRGRSRGAWPSTRAGGRYPLNELTADIQALRWDTAQGMPTPRQTLSTNAPDHTGATSAAEPAISRDGRHVHTSNRGENTLVIFSADPRTGLLTEVQRIPRAGVTPWSFSLHPGGRRLFVAHEASGTGEPLRCRPGIRATHGHRCLRGRALPRLHRFPRLGGHSRLLTLLITRLPPGAAGPSPLHLDRLRRPPSSTVILHPAGGS
ncbi:lactonase family protein [Streptomyces sp. NPDC051636]|uniref:lactonase family protein n=1 Tax=Streptomyces sp. NPDC051636 TaxID=3365663 RepID=UPI00379209DA